MIWGSTWQIENCNCLSATLAWQQIWSHLLAFHSSECREWAEPCQFFNSTLSRLCGLPSNELLLTLLLSTGKEKDKCPPLTPGDHERFQLHFHSKNPHHICNHLLLVLFTWKCAVSLWCLFLGHLSTQFVKDVGWSLTFSLPYLSAKPWQEYNSVILKDKSISWFVGS